MTTIAITAMHDATGFWEVFGLTNDGTVRHIRGCTDLRFAHIDDGLTQQFAGAKYPRQEAQAIAKLNGVPYVADEAEWDKLRDNCRKLSQVSFLTWHPKSRKFVPSLPSPDPRWQTVYDLADAGYPVRTF